MARTKRTAVIAAAALLASSVLLTGAAEPTSGWRVVKSMEAVWEAADGARQYGGGLREVAKLLGMSTEELKAAFLEGKTLAIIAKERGIDRQQVVDLIASRMEKRLDSRLSSGSLTKEEYEKRKARIPQMAAKLVDEGLPMRKGRDCGKEKESKDAPKQP